MKLSEKKDLYQRFLNNQLDAAGLEEFFLLVEQGQIDIDAVPEVEEELIPAPVYQSHPMLKLFTRIAVAASLLLLGGLGFIAYHHAESSKQQSDSAGRCDENYYTDRSFCGYPGIWRSI